MERYLSKLCLAGSLFSISLFVACIRYDLGVSILALSGLLLLFPIYIVVSKPERKYSSFVLIYLSVLAVGVGSLFLIHSEYPIGYSDVHRHIFFTSRSIDAGHISFNNRASSNFVGLYVLVEIVGLVPNVDIPTTARFLPVLTYVLVTIVFHKFISENFFESPTSIVPTVLFMFNWGVYRFNIEFRTLNLSFLFTIILVSILFLEMKNSPGEKRFHFIYLLVLAALTISHFTTAVFFIVISLVYFGTNIIHRDSRGSIPLIMSAAFLLLYLVYIGRSFDSIATYLIQITLSTIFGTSVREASVQGVVGNVFGFNVFLLRWTLRVGFIIGFLIYVKKTWLSWDLEETFLLGLSFVFGFLVFVTSMVGYVVNPSRVFTFFAIPFSILTTHILDLSDKRLKFPSWSTHRNLLVSVLLIIAVVITFAKFPAYVVGNTEPIRGHEEIDESIRLDIGQVDASSKDFYGKYIGGHSTITIRLGSGSPALKAYYKIEDPTLSDYFRKGPPRFAVKQQSSGNNSTIYDSGTRNIEIIQEGR